MPVKVFVSPEPVPGEAQFAKPTRRRSSSTDRPGLDHSWTVHFPRNRSTKLVGSRLTDGAEVWSHEFPGIVRGIGNDDSMLYVGSLKGPVYAFRSPFMSTAERLGIRSGSDSNSLRARPFPGLV